jgi:hypothetical protein
MNLKRKDRLGLKKPKLEVRHVINEDLRDVPYQFMGTELVLPKHDFDIKLIQPNGSALLIQWRIENGTVDVCFIKPGNEEEPETRSVYVSDANLKEVKRRKKGGYSAQQITIM